MKRLEMLEIPGNMVDKDKKLSCAFYSLYIMISSYQQIKGKIPILRFKNT